MLYEVSAVWWTELGLCSYAEVPNCSYKPQATRPRPDQTIFIHVCRPLCPELTRQGLSTLAFGSHVLLWSSLEVQKTMESFEVR